MEKNALNGEGPIGVVNAVKVITVRVHDLLRSVVELVKPVA